MAARGGELGAPGCCHLALVNAVDEEVSSSCPWRTAIAGGGERVGSRRWAAGGGRQVEGGGRPRVDRQGLWERRAERKRESRCGKTETRVQSVAW